MVLPTISLFVLPLATTFCPLNGPGFPPPRGLASPTILRAALEKLTTTYESNLSSSNVSDLDVPTTAAIAVQLFSTSSEEIIYEYHRSGTTLSNATGVKKVDSDSVWRIASISKLITTCLLLKELGDTWWDVVVTNVIPELKESDRSGENEVDYVKWEEVTMGSLAGQISGIVNDFVYIEEGNPISDVATATKLGLPPLSAAEYPTCVLAYESKDGMNCTRAECFAALNSPQPVSRPNTTPLYANTPFIILVYALESITGKPTVEVLKSLADALELTATTEKTPELSRAVIPVSLTLSKFERRIGEAWPFGSLYSSFNDLSRIGQSILKPTFFSPNTTRAWLRTNSFTSDMRSAVGRPWEIYHRDTQSARGVLDMFVKGGDYGLYHTKLGLVPDYDIGFIIEIVFPALGEAARAQADAAYAGTYVAAANDVNATSSITLTTEAGKPGLGVSASSMASMFSVPSEISQGRLSTA